MTDTEPKVVGVSTLGDTAIIDFDDGHQVLFEAYKYGGQVEGLRHFFLLNGKETVVRYDGRLAHIGPRQDEERFVEVADGYDIDRIIAYWQGARTYLQQEYVEKPRAQGRTGDSKLWYPWVMSQYASESLVMIRAGNAPIPENQDS